MYNHENILTTGVIPRMTPRSDLLTCLDVNNNVSKVDPLKNILKKFSVKAGRCLYDKTYFENDH